MNFIFVDTSGWFATVASKDPHHPAARTFFEANGVPLLTTDYVLDETATLFQSCLGHAAAVRFLDSIHTSPRVQVNYLTRRDIEEALWLFRGQSEKGWSMTDCTSFVVMKRLGITKAFAFCNHFREAGFQVIPEIPMLSSPVSGPDDPEPGC